MNKPHIPGRALLAPVFALAACVLPARAHLVANGDFAAGAAPWSLAVASVASATFTTPGGEGRVDIAAGGTSRSHVILQQTLAEPLAAGVTYVISFDARADAAKPFDVLVRAATSAVLGGVYGLAAGPTPTPYVVEYTHLGTDAAGARLNFRLGGNATGVTIDNVRFAPKGQPSQLLTRDASGAWVFPAVAAGGKTWRANGYDFSYSGYRYGERDQPDGVPAASVTVTAAPGENITGKLNAAIAALPSGGGTVWIPAGTFEIGRAEEPRTVTVNRDNVFLRGAGVGLTTLRVSADYHAPGANRGTRSANTYNEGVITFGDNNTAAWHYGPEEAAATAVVELGAREIMVDDPARFAEGAIIVIRQQFWRDFVEDYAYDADYTVTFEDGSVHPRPWRWSNYNAADVPLFSDRSHSFTYRRRVVSKVGSTLRLDVPIPRKLDPAEQRVNVALLHVPRLRNCGMLDLTLTAEPEGSVTEVVDKVAVVVEVAPQDSLGATVMVRGLEHGLFRNVHIASFRSIGFGTGYATQLSFVECRASDALNRGDGGAGYGFYVRGQNMLYARCTAERVRHGYTTAAPQTSNVVFKDCVSRDYGFNPGMPPGEYVDDTHLMYSHGLLWDGHSATRAGLLMVNRGRLSGAAFETCGWALVWNYRNEGEAPGWPGPSAGTLLAGHDCRENALGLSPAEFGFVVGAHAGEGPKGLRVYDGYTRWPSSSLGTPVANPALHVGPSGKVLYEHVGAPVAYSLYEALLASRPAAWTP